MPPLVAAHTRRARSGMTPSLGSAFGIGVLALALIGCGSTITKGPRPADPTIPPAPSRAATGVPDCPGTLVPDTTRVAGPIHPPQFTSALLCQYAGNPSRLSTSHQVQGATAQSFRNALELAPAWVPEPSCAPPEPSNPVVLALFVEAGREVGDAVIYLSGCHDIESPYGKANADTRFQTALASILHSGPE